MINDCRNINMQHVSSRPLPIQISNEEIEIINDIRDIDFGKICLNIQNGVVVCKEVTILTKMSKNNKKYGNNGAGCGELDKNNGFPILFLAGILPIIEISIGV